MHRPRALMVLAVVVGGASAATAGSLDDGVPAGTARPHAPPRVRHPFRQRLFTIVRIVRGSVALHSRPRARVVAFARPRTEFGSPTALSVVARRGRWLGVKSSKVPNRRLAWVDARSAALARAHTRLSLRVDLGRLRLRLLDGRRVVETARVGAGSPASPTPAGRFALTDKLAGRRFSSAYGCCVLALTGRQSRLPAGWRGGDRLAIHGTGAPSTIGARASAGCLHARDRDLAPLMRRVPLGTPVFITK